MRIARPPHDFLPEAICTSLQSKNSDSAWFDFEHANDVERRHLLDGSDPSLRVVKFLNQIKYALDGDSVLFAGFSPDRKLVWLPPHSDAASEDAVLHAIARGVPVESVGDVTRIVIPVYDFLHRHDNEDYLCGAVCVTRGREKAPLTELQWLRALHILNRWSWPILLSIDALPVKLAMVPMPKNAEVAATSWKETVRILSRENLNDMVNVSTIQNLDHVLTWLQSAVSQIGFSDSRQMHPDELLNSIGKSLSKSDAGEVSRSAATTAADISQSASESEWGETSDTILNAMSGIFEQTPAIYFVTVNHGQDEDAKSPDQLYVTHSQATPVPETAEIRALQALALWVGITGDPLYLSPEEGCNKIIQLIRGATTTRMPLFAIPIFGWRDKTPIEAGFTHYTGLHGVFIGFRRESVQHPSLAAWLTWVYTAQHMLSPMAAASRHGKLKYRPINIDRSLAKAAATPERLMLPWEYCSAWRKTRPIE